MLWNAAKNETRATQSVAYAPDLNEYVGEQIQDDCHSRHLGCPAAAIIERNLPLIESNHQKKFQVKRGKRFSSYLTETKFKMAAVVAILDVQQQPSSKGTFLS